MSGPASSLPWRTIARAAVIVAAAGLLLYFVAHIPKTVEVFIFATLLAYGVNPIVQRLLRSGCPRPVAVAIVYAGLCAAVLLAGIVIVPETVNQLQTFFANSDTYVGGLQRFFDSARLSLQERFGHRVLPPQLQDIEGYGLTRLSEMFNQALSGVTNLVVDVANAVIIGITAIILSYYFLANAEDVKTSFYSLFPEKTQPAARRFAREVARVFGGFMFGQILLSTACGVATFVVLEIARMNFALLLGVLTGLLYAIPYLGVFIAIAVGFLLGLLQSWKVAVLTAIAIFVVTKIADTLLVPKVMGESVGVSPMAIIFAVFAGSELFGLWGLVLAIPAAAIFKVVWNLWLHPWLTENPLFVGAEPVTPIRKRDQSL